MYSRTVGAVRAQTTLALHLQTLGLGVELATQTTFLTLHLQTLGLGVELAPHSFITARHAPLSPSPVTCTSHLCHYTHLSQSFTSVTCTSQPLACHMHLSPLSNPSLTSVTRTTHLCHTHLSPLSHAPLTSVTRTTHLCHTHLSPLSHAPLTSVTCT